MATGTAPNGQCQSMNWLKLCQSMHVYDGIDMYRHVSIDRIDICSELGETM